MKMLLIPMFSLATLFSFSSFADQTGCERVTDYPLAETFQAAERAYCYHGQSGAGALAKLLSTIRAGKATFNGGSMVDVDTMMAHALAGFRIKTVMTSVSGGQKLVSVLLQAPDQSAPVKLAVAIYKIDPSVSDWDFQTVKK